MDRRFLIFIVSGRSEVSAKSYVVKIATFLTDVLAHRKCFRSHNSTHLRTNKPTYLQLPHTNIKMHHYVTSLAIAAISLSVGVDAFGTPSRLAFTNTLVRTTMPTIPTSTQLFSASDSVDNEVERLRSMAAKLRAEASALEAQKAQEIADATERAFRKFDKDQDGSVTFEELKAGLEKVLKTELKEERVKKLMEEFDASGDGALQLSEFVGVEKFRNRLESLVRDEQSAAKDAIKKAKVEAEAAALTQARMELLNDKAPTTSDKIISVIPYLLPLLDGLQFGRFLLEGQDNPAVAVLAILYTIYRSIPFSGFVAFLALSVLSGNLSINRQIRFNMQQAIYLDIALFIPGLVASLNGLVLGGLGVQIPQAVSQIGSDAVFVTLLVAIGYSVASSLLGITPDKIPFVSDAANRRMPTIDMFDAQGKFIGPTRNDDNKDDSEKK